MREHTRDTPLPSLESSFDERMAHWEQRIQARGAEEAYEELARGVKDASYEDAHQHAHAFGGALYNVEGTKGLRVCDTRFSFGCFHQFLGNAIEDLGLEHVVELNHGCFDALSTSPLSCQHGIGHGILASLGYSDESLKQALDTCRDLPGTDPIGGCYGGVFMEYNVRTMLGDDAFPRNYMDNPFAPCDSLKDELVPACIYWQPQWWMQALLRGQPMMEQYATMGDYCRTFGKTTTLIRACFEGLGNMVAQASRFEPLSARALCDAAGKTPTERLLCRSVGANHFGIDVSPEAALRVCEDLPGKEKEYCNAYGRNELNVANIGILPL
jgi:hypothetical protein